MDVELMTKTTVLLIEIYYLQIQKLIPFIDWIQHWTGTAVKADRDGNAIRGREPSSMA